MESRTLSEQEHADVVASLRRHQAAQHADSPRLSVFQLIQLAAVAVLATGLVTGVVFLSVAGGVLGSLALALSLRSEDVDHDPLAASFDPLTGLPLASTLPIVLHDPQVMASLGGRVSVLALDIGAAVDLAAAGYHDAMTAVRAGVLHRLQSDSLLYSGTGAFSPLVFLDEPGTLLVVRRDVLGDESDYWLADRTLRELDKPVSLGERQIAPDVVAGGATGPVCDAAALVPMALLARTEARRGGGGTTVLRTLDRTPTSPVDGAELVVASNDIVLGRWFGMPDAGPRVGIFEQFGTLGMTLSRAIEATSADGSVPFIGVSATALANPRSVAELVARASAADLRGRVGLVLPPDFPTAPGHRAVRAVADLHAAGFYVVADRIELWSRLRDLPSCPIDAVLVGSDLALGAPASPADRALLEATVQRQCSLVHSRTALPAERSLDSSVLDAVAGLSGPVGPDSDRSQRPNVGGRSDHPATAPATPGR